MTWRFGFLMMLLLVVGQLIAQNKQQQQDTKVVVRKGGVLKDSIYRNILFLTTPNEELLDVGGYNLGPYYELSDSSKIWLIEELLSYRNDVTLDSKKVCRIFGNSGTKRTPHSQKYTIQIEALLKINSLCFGTYCNGYSPFPVLVNFNKEEINGDNEAIMEVFDIYEKWFWENRIKGFKNYRFPVTNKDKYSWYDSSVPKDGILFPEFFKDRLPDNFGNCR